MAVGCVRSLRVFLVSDIRIFGTPPLLSVCQDRDWSRRHRCYRHFCTKASDTRNKTAEVEYRRGLPHVLVPLPSSRQRCLFALKPLGNTVGDLINMIKTEDTGVSTVAFTTMDNIRIASSNTIANLVEEDFKMKINDKEYVVKAPEKLEKPDLDRLSEIRTLVQQLYTSLNACENTAKLEIDLQSELDNLKKELEPLEKKKEELDRVAGRKANALTWVGLGMMSMQFGILARLTWWEYSWDIMEPVTYFVTYGTAMAAYAYFVLTRQEYLLPDVRDRQKLLSIHKRAAKVGLDLSEYNRLKNSVAHLEHSLARIKDPLTSVQVPPVAVQFRNSRPQGEVRITPNFSTRLKASLFSLFSSSSKEK